MDDNLDETLKERGNRYGPYNLLAQRSQSAQMALHVAGVSDPVLRESLQIICTKLARICTGDSEYIDNWHDIAGYAKLVEDHLENRECPF